MMIGYWAQKCHEDGRAWLYIEGPDGYGHQECLSDWDYVMDLVSGTHYYRHKRDGREISAKVPD